MEDSKTCPRCKSNKDLTCFYLDKSKKDGLSYDCKDCKKAQSVKWREDNREHHRAYSRQWFREHSEQAYETTRKWCLSNPEKSRGHKRKWEKANPDKTREKTLRRRAMLALVSIYKVSPKDIAKILRQPCLYCGAKSEHIDHIIPLNKGGFHSMGNLGPSCMRCNSSKKDKFVMEWKLWKSRQV